MCNKFVQKELYSLHHVLALRSPCVRPISKFVKAPHRPLASVGGSPEDNSDYVSL